MIFDVWVKTATFEKIFAEGKHVEIRNCDSRCRRTTAGANPEMAKVTCTSPHLHNTHFILLFALTQYLSTVSLHILSCTRSIEITPGLTFERYHESLPPFRHSNLPVARRALNRVLFFFACSPMSRIKST